MGTCLLWMVHQLLDQSISTSGGDQIFKAEDDITIDEAGIVFDRYSFDLI